MKKYYILAITIILPIHFCFSQWVQMDGPYGSTSILAFIPHDSLLFASSDCGLFSKKSIDDPWKLNSTVSFSVCTKIGDSLFYSDNKLKRIDLSQPGNPPVAVNSLLFTVLAHADSCLYGGNHGDGFGKSNDFGLTWSYHSGGLPADTGLLPFPPYFYYNYSINDIAVTNDYIFCGTNKGLFRNSGALLTWTALQSGLPLSKVTLIKSFNDTVYTAMGNDLYRSADLGDTWTLLHTFASPVSAVAIINNQYFVGTSGNGISHSTDYGTSWNDLNATLPDWDITTLASYGATLICGTKAKGAFSFQGNQWNSQISGMVCSWIKSMAITQQGLAANDQHSLYLSNDGNAWHAANIPDIPSYPNLSSGIGAVLGMGDTIFMSYDYTTPDWPYSHSFIQYTKDACNTWDTLFSAVPFAGDDPYRMYGNKGRLYAYEDSKMYYTDNLGLNWINLSLPAQYCNAFNDFIVYDDVPYAEACGFGQLLELDDTDHWALRNNGLPTDREPTALARCDSALFAYILVHGMYVSFDGGDNWTYAGNGIQTNYSIRDYAYKGDVLFVTSNYGVFVTKDFGRHWATINAGLINRDVGPIVILNDTLYVGTFGNGIWKQSLSDLTVSAKDYPDTAQWLEIYPNPASEVVHVSAGSNKARFKIVDMPGKEILAGDLSASKEINIFGIPCGVYVLIVQDDKRVQAVKLLINR